MATDKTMLSVSKAGIQDLAMFERDDKLRKQFVFDQAKTKKEGARFRESVLLNKCIDELRSRAGMANKNELISTVLFNAIKSDIK